MRWKIGVREDNESEIFFGESVRNGISWSTLLDSQADVCWHIPCFCLQFSIKLWHCLILFNHNCEDRKDWKKYKYVFFSCWKENISVFAWHLNFWFMIIKVRTFLLECNNNECNTVKLLRQHIELNLTTITRDQMSQHLITC